MLNILGKLLITFYLIAPVIALIMLFIVPPISLVIFILWISSAGTIIGLVLLTLALISIWRNE